MFLTVSNTHREEGCRPLTDEVVPAEVTLLFTKVTVSVDVAEARHVGAAFSVSASLTTPSLSLSD